MTHTNDEVLRQHAISSAEAVAGVLREFVGDDLELGEPEVATPTALPLESIAVPAVAARISYVGAATGGTLFVTTVTGARRLAAAMSGVEIENGAHPLTDFERSAVAEAMNKMMVAAVEATSHVLGESVEIAAPDIREIESVEEARALAEGAPHATGVSLTMAGEPCRLVQLVPKAFVVKMVRALDELSATEFPDTDDTALAGAGSDDILRGVRLRVCAEIGRANMPLGDAVSVPSGGVIELDRSAEDLVDVLVNGRRFATGRLVLIDDEWAVRIEEILLDGAGVHEAAFAADA